MKIYLLVAVVVLGPITSFAADTSEIRDQVSEFSMSADLIKSRLVEIKKQDGLINRIKTKFENVPKNGTNLSLSPEEERAMVALGHPELTEEGEKMRLQLALDSMSTNPPADVPSRIATIGEGIEAARCIREFPLLKRAFVDGNSDSGLTMYAVARNAHSLKQEDALSACLHKIFDLKSTPSHAKGAIRVMFTELAKVPKSPDGKPVRVIDMSGGLSQ